MPTAAGAADAFLVRPRHSSQLATDRAYASVVCADRRCGGHALLHGRRLRSNCIEPLLLLQLLLLLILLLPLQLLLALHLLGYCCESSRCSANGARHIHDAMRGCPRGVQLTQLRQPRVRGRGGPPLRRLCRRRRHERAGGKGAAGGALASGLCGLLSTFQLREARKQRRVLLLCGLSRCRNGQRRLPDVSPAGQTTMDGFINSSERQTGASRGSAWHPADVADALIQSPVLPCRAAICS